MVSAIVSSVPTVSGVSDEDVGKMPQVRISCCDVPHVKIEVLVHLKDRSLHYNMGIDVIEDVAHVRKEDVSLGLENFKLDGDMINMATVSISFFILASNVGVRVAISLDLDISFAIVESYVDALDA